MPTTLSPKQKQRPKHAPNYGIGSRTEAPVARWHELALILGSGFLANLAFRTSFATAAAVISGVLLIVALAFSGRKLARDSLVLIGLAAVLLPWLLVRSNPALTAVTILMILMLLAIATGLSQAGRLADSKLRGLTKHMWALSYEWFFGTVMVKRLLIGTSSRPQRFALLRGALFAAPVLFVFALLLASADEVFARLLLIGNLPSVVGHVIGTGLLAVAFLGYLSRRAHETPTGGHENLRRVGSLEVTVVLGSLALLFSAFVATQVVVALGGADHVLETEGLTQADHARRGFFQLLWVAGLSMALVSLLRAVRKADGIDDGIDDHTTFANRDRFRPLAILTLLLTVLIAGISVQRLLLYIGTFGLTPLRLWSLIGAGAIGFAILIYVLSVGGYRSGQSWYPAVAIFLGFGVVFGLNVLNPDATIANYNISHAENGPPLDVQSLTRLSDDATSTVVDRLSDLGVAESRVVAQLCSRFDRQTAYGVFEYNRAAVKADGLLDTLCVQPRPERDDSFSDFD